MATHWLGAGRKDRASTYSVTAAERAAAALAFDHAARLYQHALDLGVSGSDERSLRLRLAEALTNAGRAAEAAEVRLALARDTDSLEALDLRRQAAEQFLCSGHFDRGKALLEEVLEAVRVPFPQSSAALIALLMVNRTRLRLRGTAFRERAEAHIARRDLLRADTLRSAGAGFSMSDLMRGAFFQAQATVAALELGEPHRVLHALAFETIFLSSDMERNRARVEQLLGTVAALGERLGTAQAMALVGTARGYYLFNSAKFAEARTQFVEAEEIFRDRCVAVPFEIGSVRVVMFRTLMYLGAAKELARRVPAIQRDVEQRRDLYSLANLRATALPFLALATDEPDRSRALLDEVEGSLTRKVFLLQHVFALNSRVQMELYVDDVLAAHRAIESVWAPLERSLLLNVAAIRTFAWSSRARCAIAAAARSPHGREALLREASRSLDRLVKEKRAWADAEVAAGRALLARVRGKRDEALETMRRAAEGFEALRMGLSAAACKYRYGEWRGGDAGAAAVREATEALRAEGIKEPAKMARCFAPAIP
jgi:tetratricopeptide (TPR) repeat protein